MRSAMLVLPIAIYTQTRSLSAFKIKLHSFGAKRDKHNQTWQRNDQGYDSLKFVFYNLIIIMLSWDQWELLMRSHLRPIWVLRLVGQNLKALNCSSPVWAEFVCLRDDGKIWENPHLVGTNPIWNILKTIILSQRLSSMHSIDVSAQMYLVDLIIWHGLQTFFGHKWLIYSIC